MRSEIIGIGSYLPPNIVTNDDLTKFMDTSDEWIQQRTGIKQRHWIEPGSGGSSDLGFEAAKEAIEKSGIDKSDIDMILFATITVDHEFPGNACFLQAKLGLPGIPAVDVRQQCSGFLYALSQADQYIRTESYKTILVVGAEVHSVGLNKTTEGRDVAVLFGDGAGAVVLRAREISDPKTDSHIFSTHIHADGSFAKALWLSSPGCSHKERMSHEHIDKGLHFPQMNGKAVYVNAVKKMPEAIMEACNFNEMSLDDIDLFIFHQANLRINEAVAKTLKLPSEKVFNTIDRFANTTAATIPLGLYHAEKEGKLKKGDLVAAAAFGSGFTWASSIFRW